MCHGHLGRVPSRAGRPWHLKMSHYLLSTNVAASLPRHAGSGLGAGHCGVDLRSRHSGAFSQGFFPPAPGVRESGVRGLESFFPPTPVVRGCPSADGRVRGLVRRRLGGARFQPPNTRRNHNSGQIVPRNPQFSAKCMSLCRKCPTFQRAFCRSFVCFHIHSSFVRHKLTSFFLASAQFVTFCCWGYQ